MNSPEIANSNKGQLTPDTAEPMAELPISQRVELIAFPPQLGEELRSLIKNRHGRDCLQFQAERLVPKVLLGESTVRCIWIDTLAQTDESSFQGTVIGIGENLSVKRQSHIIAQGYTTTIDLAKNSVADAANIVCAYVQQSAKGSLLHRELARTKTHIEAPSLPSLEPSDLGTAYLATAVEILEIGVYVIDETRGGIVTVWNGEMERLFQRSKRAVLGKKLESIFDDSLICGVFRDMPSSYTRNRAIFPSKGQNRSNFIADISKTQLKGANGKHAAIVGIIQDVTARIHSENRLIAAFNELESSKEKLEQSNIEIRKGIEKAKKLAVVAQSSNKAKSYFLSNISHELRTPLNSIVSLTHALLEGTFGDLNKKQHEHLEIVSDSSKHLQALINDILDLSKIELGKMNLKISQTEVEDIARSSIRMIEQEASFKQVRCLLDIQLERKTIEADAKRLKQILLNLLVNAVKFTKPNTDVTLRIEEDPATQSVLFHVIDHGIGINQNDFGKIFSPFTQLDDSLSRQYEGTGLGLAIASKFVELHGGGLRVASKPGKGSTFTISLPIVKPRNPADKRTQLSLADIATDSRTNRNLLLVVDENERSALHIENQAESYSKLSPIITLPNEISAYHDQIAPKAIFVDLSIISAHGSDWIQHAKRLPAWKKTKWFAIGSLDLPENQLHAKRLGFESFTCKPIANSHFAELSP